MYVGLSFDPSLSHCLFPVRDSLPTGRPVLRSVRPRRRNCRDPEHPHEQPWSDIAVLFPIAAFQCDNTPTKPESAGRRLDGYRTPDAGNMAGLIKATHVLLGPSTVTYHDYCNYSSQFEDTTQSICFTELCNNLVLTETRRPGNPSLKIAAAVPRASKDEYNKSR